jgi:ATP-binding cassette subfamily F protein 3
LSGGEKARLLMGLATFAGPHLLIMDEPTNHLDIDSRAALIEAINEYQGAVILVSHDRYLLEACADRLWLVADGTVTDFDGDMNDYRRFVLDGANSERASKRRAEKQAKPDRKVEAVTTESRPTGRPAAETKSARREAKKKLDAIDEKMNNFRDLMGRIDKALTAPDVFKRDPAKAQQLAQQRQDLERALSRLEEEWLMLSEETETA